MTERYDRGMAYTFLLIHSPLVGPYTWRPAQRELQARGHQTVVPSLLEALEGRAGFSRAITAAVEGQLEGQNLSGEPYLVLHSAAGAFVSAVREAVPAPVTGYIFVDARLPEDGASLSDQDPEEQVLQRREMARAGMLPAWSDWYPAEVLAQVLPAARTRERFIEELRPIPLGLFEEPLRVTDGWPDAPCGYLQLSPFYKPQAEAAQAAGWPVILRDLAHLHMLVRPAEVVELILEMHETLKG